MHQDTPIFFRLLDSRLEVSVHPEGPVTGHLGTGFLSLPLSSSKCWAAPQFPSCYRVLPCSPRGSRLLTLDPFTIKVTKFILADNPQKYTALYPQGTLFLFIFPVTPTLEHRASVKSFLSLSVLSLHFFGGTEENQWWQAVCRPRFESSTSRISLEPFTAVFGVIIMKPLCCTVQDTICIVEEMLGEKYPA